jgi:glycerophosphoryl diester phosphodiesterase
MRNELISNKNKISAPWVVCGIFAVYLMYLYLLFLIDIEQISILGLWRVLTIGAAAFLVQRSLVDKKVGRLALAAALPIITVVYIMCSYYYGYFGAVPVPSLAALGGNLTTIFPIFVDMLRPWHIGLVIAACVCSGFIYVFGRRIQAVSGKQRVLLLGLTVVIWALPLLIPTQDYFEKGQGPNGKNMSGLDFNCFFQPEKALGKYGYFVYVCYSLTQTPDAFDNSSPLPNPMPLVQEALSPERRPNIVVIQVESLDKAVVDYMQDGRLATPFLHTLSQCAYFATNYFAVHAIGGSSDSEIAALTGLLPFPGAVTMTQLPLSHIWSLPKELARYGYTSHAYHGVDKDLWGRRSAYKQLGFEAYHGGEAFSGTAVGWHSDDRAFLEQTLDYLEAQSKQEQPYFAYVITQSMHDPFNTIPESKLDQHFQHKNERLGRYLRHANYTDTALKSFVQGLQARGMLENTVVIIYGDHCTDFEEADYTPRLSLIEPVPLFIVLPWQPGKELSIGCSPLDISPTILDIIGAPPAQQLFGRSLMRFYPDRLMPMDLDMQVTAITPSGKIPVDQMPNPMYLAVSDYSRSQFTHVESIAMISTSVLETTQFIAHAMGSINGETYSNSLEAFKRSYAMGVKVFEVDFTFTKDQKLVGIHDAPSAESIGLPGALSDYTLEEMRRCKVRGEYTLLDLRDVIELMVEYPDMYLVTDFKDDFTSSLRQLVDAASEVDAAVLERMIPQIYAREQLAELNKFYPFQNVIFKLYRTTDSDDTVADFSVAHEQIAAVAVSRQRFSQYLLNRLLDAQIPQFVYTVNDTTEIAHLCGMRVTGVYCDLLFDEAFEQ